MPRPMPAIVRLHCDAALPERPLTMTTSSVSPHTLHAISRRHVTLAGARAAIAAAREQARREGVCVSVAVVDRAGELVACERDDDAGPVTPRVALEKTRTAVLLRAVQAVRGFHQRRTAELPGHAGAHAAAGRGAADRRRRGDRRRRCQRRQRRTGHGHCCYRSGSTSLRLT